MDSTYLSNLVVNEFGPEVALTLENSPVASLVASADRIDFYSRDKIFLEVTKILLLGFW